MAAPSIDTLKAYDYGYLLGADLLQYCPYQILAQKDAVDSDFLDSWGHFLDEDLYQKSFKKKRKESTKTKLENDRKHFLESIKVLDNMETQIQEKKKNNLLKGYNPFILYEG